MRCPEGQSAAHPACVAPLTASSGSCRRLRPETACPHSPSETYLLYPRWPRGTIPYGGRRVRSRSDPPEWPHSSFRRMFRPCEGFERESHEPPVLYPFRTRHKSEPGRWWAPSAQSAGAKLSLGCCHLRSRFSSGAASSGQHFPAAVSWTRSRSSPESESCREKAASRGNQKPQASSREPQSQWFHGRKS